MASMKYGAVSTLRRSGRAIAHGHGADAIAVDVGRDGRVLEQQAQTAACST